MEEKEPLQNQEEERENWTPASFEKRAAAWMGIAYVLMVLFVINFAMYTGGRQLPEHTYLVSPFPSW